MTVNTTTITSGPYTATGGQTIFDYTFRADVTTDIDVYVNEILRSDYTISNLGEDAGGEITFTSGLTSGDEVYIISSREPTQDVEFSSQGGFYPEEHERAFDKLTYLIQQLSDKIKRTLRISDTKPALSIVDLIAGKFLQVNGTGTGFQMADTPSYQVSDGITVATFADLVNVAVSAEGQIVYVVSHTSDGLGGGEFRSYAATHSTSDGINYINSATAGYRFERIEPRKRYGSFSIVFDTTNETVRDTLLPLVTAAGYRAALAVPYNALGADYDRMTLSDLHDYCKENNGEVLSHGANGVVLNSSVATSSGNSWIRSSHLDLVQCGFSTRGYVAISSTMDSKFLPELKRWYDYAFINSSDGTSPVVSANDESTDIYNMYRVSLESSTEAKIQACLDYAKTTFTNVVFYTHDATTNLAELIAYATSIGIKCELPSEWVSRVHGLSNPSRTVSAQNLIVNSGFLKQKTTDKAPISWGISSSTMTSIASAFYQSEAGQQIDITATAAGIDESLLFSQTYSCGPILQYTPFCFSCNATGLDATNTKIRITLSARDASNNVLAQNVRDFTVRADQSIYCEQGFCAGGTAVSYILVAIELRSLAAGDVRAIISNPMLARAGCPVPYIKTNLNPSFVKMRKNTQGSALPASTDNVVLFDNVLSGANDFYDMSTGEWLSNDGGKYLMTVTLGLKAMVDADRMTIKLFVGGSQREQVDYYCIAGQNINNCSFLVPADGLAYQIRIWHNSAADRLTTTGHDATLSITRVSD